MAFEKLMGGKEAEEEEEEEKVENSGEVDDVNIFAETGIFVGHVLRLNY